MCENAGGDAMGNSMNSVAPPASSLPTAPKRRVTSYDVARTAGVAQSTVSRCFRGDSNISPSTRACVLDAARRIGYTPNALARGLITQRSDMVGVIATRYTLRGNPDVIHAIGEALAEAGKQLLLVTARDDSPTLGDLRGALEYPLDGLISCVLMADEDLADLRERGINLVLYNRISLRIPVDGVTTNHREAAAAAASVLVRAGHRRFLCVGGPPEAPVSRARIAGFLDRLGSLGIEQTPVIETDYSYGQGHDRFLAAMEGAIPPEAVFCANDQIALGVMDACRFRLGLAVPGDISVVGFDDIAEAARPVNDLTTIRQNSVEMARLAVQVLLRRLAEPDLPVMNTQVEAVFVARGSARLG
jgi:DNA-binding LacI/PurR family transcriptional regulator